MKVTFKKEIDKTNQFDNAEIAFSVEAVHIGDLVEEFGRFLLACGFHPENVNDYLGLDSEE